MSDEDTNKPQRKASKGAKGRLPPTFDASSKESDAESPEAGQEDEDGVVNADFESTRTVDLLEDDAGSEDVENKTKTKTKTKLPTARKGAQVTRKADVLAAYLSEVRRHPLLDPEEEKEIAINYVETGDPEAAARLVTANLRLVVKLAFQYHRQWADVLDLIQEGNVGLVEALSRYDPYRGIRFSSYAQYWIRAMILRYLMDNYRMVRLGSTRHGRKLFFQLQKEKNRLAQMGIKPSTKALSESLKIPEKEIVNVDQHLSAPALSLHAPMGGEEGRSLSDVVTDDEAIGPESTVANQDLGGKVREQLEEFAHELRDEREVAIWYERLVAEDPISLAALGERFGVSKERIRQVEGRIKKRLKLHLRRGLGDEIDFEFSMKRND